MSSIFVPLTLIGLCFFSTLITFKMFSRTMETKILDEQLFGWLFFAVINSNFTCILLILVCWFGGLF